MRKLFLAIVVLSLSVPALTAVAADSALQESTTNKMKDDLGDAKTKTKKVARAAKQKARKAMGTDSALKDAKDKTNDVTDDISNESAKAQRRVLGH